MSVKTVITYELNDSQTEFQIPFEYLSRKFIKVFLIGNKRKELTLGSDYRFLNKKIIKTTNAWGQSEGYRYIEIRRVTSATERVVDFNDGSILRASDLNAAQIQAMHIAEEARDLAADSLYVNDNGDLDARGRKIVNLGDAIDGKDATNYDIIKSKVDVASNSAKEAKKSEVAAKASEEAANVSAVRAGYAQEAAEAARDTAKGYSDNTDKKYNYIVSRIQSAESAADRAELAETTATSKANVATTQAVTATASAEAAANSAKSAASSAKLSAESIATCEASEVAAKNSEVKAKASEVAAKASETNTKASENKAVDMFNKGQAFAVSAERAADKATLAESIATAKSNIATTSATSASASAEAAAGSAKSAAASSKLSAESIATCKENALTATTASQEAVKAKDLAKTSEKNAKSSETKAQQYAQESTQAQGAAASAKASAAVAENKAEEAQASAVQSMNAQAAVEAASQVAHNAQIAALKSQQQAEGASTAANTSARNAKTSETRSAENRSVTVMFAQQAEASANKSELAEGVSTMKSKAAEDAAVAAAKSAEASAKSAEAAAASARGTAQSVQSCTTFADNAALSAKKAQEAASTAVGGGIPKVNLKQAVDDNPENVLSQAGLSKYYVKKDGEAGRIITVISKVPDSASGVVFKKEDSGDTKSVGLYFESRVKSGLYFADTTTTTRLGVDIQNDTIANQNWVQKQVTPLAPKNAPTFTGSVTFKSGRNDKITIENEGGTTPCIAFERVEDGQRELAAGIWLAKNISGFTGLYFRDPILEKRIAVDFTHVKGSLSRIVVEDQLPVWKKVWSGNLVGDTNQDRTQVIEMAEHVKDTKGLDVMIVSTTSTVTGVTYPNGYGKKSYLLRYTTDSSRGNYVEYSITNTSKTQITMSYRTDATIKEVWVRADVHNRL